MCTIPPFIKRLSISFSRPQSFSYSIDFIKQFLPLLTNEGRVVIVSSLMGALSEHKESIRNKLQDNQIT